MRRLSRVAALGALFLFSLIPFEAKATVATLFTGVDLVCPQAPLPGNGFSRGSRAPHQRPARLARQRLTPPALPAPAPREVPLPAVPKLSLRPASAPVRALEGHRRYLGRERAPPA